MTKGQGMDPNVFDEQKVWGLPGNEKFFMDTRSSVDHLYRSELFFLPHVLPQVKNCLDVGCACGDFFSVMKHFNPQVDYAGVDIIDRFIAIARDRFPDGKFDTADGVTLSFADNAFEMVHTTGILHLNSHFKDIIREMYRVASKFVLCDLRLTDGPEVVGSMGVELTESTEGSGRLPYYVVNKDEILGFLASLGPAPALIQVKGYPHAPTRLAELPLDTITMAFFLIYKGTGAEGKTRVEMKLDL
jgi:hypothetical protein